MSKNGTKLSRPIPRLNRVSPGRVVECPGASWLAVDRPGLIEDLRQMDYSPTSEPA